jgi:hypothetical protein
VSTPRSAGPRSQASGRNRSSTASDHLLWPPRRPPPQPAQTFSSPRPPGSRWTSERSGRQHALRRALRRAGPARRRRVHSRDAAPPTSPRHHPAANTAFAPKELTIHRPTWRSFSKFGCPASSSWQDFGLGKVGHSGRADRRGRRGPGRQMAAILTAVPDTAMPPSQGISTLMTLGRPRSSPCRMVNEVGGSTSPSSRR